MKTFLATLAIFGTLVLSPCATGEDDIYQRWTVVGEWQATHPHWTDVITFREDGTMFLRDQESTGRWVLTADGGTPLLVLRWDAYGTESLMMVDANHMRGQIQPGSFMDMRRENNAIAPNP